MKQEVIKLEEVNKFNDIFGLEALHPMVSVIDLSKSVHWPETLTINYGVYAIYLKKTKCGDLTYGMQEYDYDEGTIVCFAPGQVVTSHMNPDTKPEGYGILFHQAFACAYVLNGRKLDYPVYFDSEYAVPGAHTGRADKLTKAERTACAVAFCEEIKKWGYQPGVYASTSWYSTQLDFNALRSYNIWNAHYGIPGPRMDCALWQGTCEGRIDGISGGVDINISYIG